MPALNLKDVSSIFGKTAGLALTTSAQDLLENASPSSKLLKVNWVSASNVDGTVSANVTLSFYDASEAATYDFRSQIPVPAGAALDIVRKESYFYLEEGDKLTALASANGDIQLLVSYEEMS